MLRTKEKRRDAPELRASTLGDRFSEVRDASMDLAASLSPEDQCIQSMPDASPTKWHLAHTTWFFETFVLPNHEPFHPQFGFLFNSYYQTVGQMHARPRRGLLSRPSVAEVATYRRHVDDAVLELLGAGTSSPEQRALIELGLHHEQQHQELVLTDIKHAFSCNPLQPAYLPPRPRQSPPELSAMAWKQHEGGVVEIGWDGRGFAYDNEGPRHREYLRPFALATRPVTCGEFLEFMNDGGYERPELWLSAGWESVQSRGWHAPAYWSGDWTLLTLHGPQGFFEDEPVVHLSYYEADAYARWAGYRLPTEAEWEVIAADSPVEGNLVDSKILHPRTAEGQGEVPIQLFGDVWEWTASPYAPYPGYQPPAGPVGEYNGKFMCNQMVLRGGSCATPRSHVRASYRNFFYPADRWQFSGLRLAKDLDPSE